MKRTALLFAGIIAATILVVMGLGIFMTGSFYFMPSITIDPFSDRDIDENGMMVLTGTTNLGVNTYLLVNVSGSSGQAPSSAGAHVTALASVLPGTGGRNSWKAAVNMSSLSPGVYTLLVSSVTFAGNNRTTVPGNVYVMDQFRLGTGSIDAARGLPTPFINVNNIGEKAPGERIEVTGTTNIEPGTSLLWKVDPVNFKENGTSGAGTPILPHPEGNTAVAPGNAGVNRWSFAFDSSGMQPGCYNVSLAGNFSGNTTEGMVVFVLSGSAARATPLPSRFITIDTIPDQQVNTRVVITGTTSLPAGEELLVEISPLAGSGYDFVVNPKDMSQGAFFAGVAGTAVVVPGSGYNLWSMDFDTYHLPPGEYGVNVSNSRMDPATARIEPGNVFSTGNFTVRGENS